MTPPPCFVEPGDVSVSLGIFLCVGTLISFLPQHYSLLRRRSHLGISFMWLWINNFGNFCNTFSDVLDQWSKIECCSQLGPWRCTETLLVFLQLGINWACIFLVFILALVFFEYDGTKESYNQRLTAWCSFFFYIFLVGFGMGTAFVFTLLMDPNGPAQVMAKVLGIVSAVIPIFGPGSLSLTMQVIQTPGSFIQAFFQIWSGEWLVGMTAAISGFEQLLLVLMCTYFLGIEWWRARKAKKEGAVTKPLLDNSEMVGTGYTINGEDDSKDGIASWVDKKVKVIEEVDQDAPA